MNDTVAVLSCKSYEEVEAALDRALALIGGLTDCIKPGMKVLIKCNLVVRKPPEAAATTHPAVAAAIAKRVRALGAFPVFGDSPGGPLGSPMLAQYYRATGLEEAAKVSGAELSLHDETKYLDIPQGKVLHRMDITAMCADCDAVISVGKLKTHGMTMMTGCVKNLFGCVPGLTKMEYHARFPQLKQFSDMLTDIAVGVKPVLSILDGILAMEGEGPSGGSPRFVGALVVGRNPHAVDLAGAKLIGLAPESVCTLARAEERGLLAPESVRFVGDDIASLCVTDFVLPRSARDIRFFSKTPVIGTAINLLTMPRPTYDRNICFKCGVCAKSCPAHAIRLAPYPKADLKRCIRCFCCQELCPKHAVIVKKSLVRSFLR